MKDKIKSINLVLLIQVVAVLMIETIRRNNKYFLYSEGKVTFSTMLMLLLAVVLLVRKNEQIFNNSKYRLIPMSETRLYFGNLVTSCLTYLYVVFGEFIIFNIAFYMVTDGQRYAFTVANLTDTRLLAYRLKLVLIVSLGVVLVLTISTMFHFLTNMLSNFIVWKNLKIMMTMFYSVILVITFLTFYQTIRFVSRLSLEQYGGMSDSFIKIILIYLIPIIILTVVNIYSLNRWSETIR
ncbi:hypothetical protein [Companilactobacillus kimchiensis]|nr:hypothetical protein [Companilactobacillus kimchiensis]